MIYDKITQTVGNTPILRFKEFESDDSAEIYGKLEFFNPAGSVKDRVAVYIIEKLLSDGSLKAGDTIIEATSGNTGIGIAMAASANNLNSIIVMPDNMSIERQKILKAYGAQVILTPSKYGMSGSIKKAKDLIANNGYKMLNQFNNELNSYAHSNTTALEIINDFDTLDSFVAGVGTGGTLTGNARKLKTHFNNIEIIAVEPDKSAVLSGKNPNSHKIQGIGAGFIPPILDTNLIDNIELVSSNEAYSSAINSSLKMGVLLGISGGASLTAAIKTAKRLGKGKKVLFIVPDNGERYLSTDLYE